MARASSCLILCANLAWNLVNFRSGLIKALHERGFRIIAVAPPDPAMEKKLVEMGCEFEPIALDAAGTSPWRDLNTLISLAALVRKHRPAAWLSWTIKPNTYGTFAATWYGVPAFPNVSGMGTAFIRRSVLTTIALLIYRIAFRRATTVFFQNQADQEFFLERGLVRTDQAQLLPGSGIDTVHFAVSSQRPERRSFLMIARLVADKGVREYVAAARLLREQYADARYRLVGPAEVANRTAIPRAELDRWVADGVIEYIEPQEDVRPLIETADFVVLPSYREGLSRVLLEAAAMGRPCVTTDVPGCRDIVTDGVNGYLCAPQDVVSLAEALERAARTDDETWGAMSRAGWKRAVDEFSLQRVNRIYLAKLAEAGIGVPVTEASLN